MDAFSTELGIRLSFFLNPHSLRHWACIWGFVSSGMLNCVKCGNGPLSILKLRNGFILKGSCWYRKSHHFSMTSVYSFKTSWTTRPGIWCHIPEDCNFELSSLKTWKLQSMHVLNGRVRFELWELKTWWLSSYIILLHICSKRTNHWYIFLRKMWNFIHPSLILWHGNSRTWFMKSKEESSWNKFHL